MEGNLSDRVAHALVWTTDRIASGRGKSELRLNRMYLGDIQKHLGHRVPDAVPRYALMVEEIEVDPGGPEVAADKTSSGLFVLTADSCLLSQDAGWARTFTRGFEIDGLRAEPVTCSIKGRPAAGFRITGGGSRVFALDPRLTGAGGGQAMIRDRVVSGFNGEGQAPPGHADTTGHGRTAVLRLVPAGSPTDDLRSPPLDPEGRLVLDAGEVVIHHAQHPVEIMRHEPVALGSDWTRSPGPEAPADVWITDRRAAVAWMDWQGEPSSGHLLERRRRAGFAEHHKERLVVAGHLTAPWISQIFVGLPQGSLELQAFDRDLMIRLRILGLDAAEAERLLRATASAVAERRLETDDTVTPEQRATLTVIRESRAPVDQLSWGISIVLPSSYKIGRDPVTEVPATTAPAVAVAPAQPVAAAPAVAAARSCAQGGCAAFGRPARGAFCGACGSRTVAT